MSELQSNSLFQVGGNCCGVAHAERVAMLVDGETYFDTFIQAAERAQCSILILAWDFDSRTVLRFDANGEPSAILGDFLNALAQRNRRLHIHILDWDYPMVFGADREFSPLYGLSWKPHRRVHFRYDNTHPVVGSHHQKIVVIDDKLAFVGGLDLTCKRWDTREHLPNDPRRMAGGKPYPPFHDVMIALDGEAGRAIAAIARKRWEKATDEVLEAVQVISDPWPDALKSDIENVQVGIACTSPAAEGGDEMRDVEQLYLDMIARAKDYIYIENQYFTAQKIGDALSRRLAEQDCPEIVIITRLLSHGWLEEMTMHVLRTRLIARLRALDVNQRFHVYYPHVDGLAEGTCVDVHAKMMIVDDEWLRVGSANLSNRSMGLDTECDVTVEAGRRDNVTAVIRRFRDDAIAEHHGVSADVFAAALQRTGAIHGAIASLGSPQRQLRPLTEMEQWSDALIDTVSLADPERPVSMNLLVEQFAPDVELHQAKPVWKKIAAFVLALIALTLAWRFTPLAGMITADKVTAWAEHFAGYWWAPVLIVLAYTPASLIMFPRPLITLGAVVAFGAWQGFVYAIVGILLSAGLHYLAGTLFPRDMVRRIAGKRLNRMTHALRKNGLLAVTALRLVPIAPFAVEGIVAGAIRIKLWHFLLGTFIAMLPGVLTATIFAGQLEAALRDASRINYWLVAGVAAFFVVAMFLVRRWFKKLEAQETTAEAVSAHGG
ncbi:MAG: VTT domain-containing protein [Betaproteobacteria bacterium]